jgi:hypothetical protein
MSQLGSVPAGKKINKIGWLAALLPDLSWLAAVLLDISWLGSQLDMITDFYFPVGPFLQY